MKHLLRYLRQQTWLMVLPLLLMTAFSSTAIAAGTPSFSATTSGTNNNLTLAANINIADADVGRVGNVYIGFNFEQDWYFNDGTSWLYYTGDPAAIYANGQLSNRNIELLRNQDVSTLIGGRVWVGYGLTQDDMLANSKFGMIYAIEADTTAPTVTGTINTNGATNVAINTAVGVTFSEEMNPATITNTNFTLKETLSGTVVTGTVSYTGVSAAFTPSIPLAINTGYTVTVKGGANGAKDLAGNPLANDFVINWTTTDVLDTVAPTITGTVNDNGAYGVAINTAVGATFSEAINPLTLTSANFFLSEAVSDILVAGTVSYSGVNAVFTPASNLLNGLTYNVTIKGGANGVKDLAGNAMASDYTWGWWTFAAPVQASDTTAPTVTGSINANGATNVAVNTSVGITFSEAMAPLTITNLNFTLKETVSGNAVAGTISYSGVNAVFIPLTNLANNTSYTVTVKGGASGVKDLASNALASDYVISWTTAAAVDTTAPTVASTAIADLATNVAINTAVGATFSEAMDPLSVTTATFTLQASGPPLGATIAGLVSYNALTKIATFTPSSNLANSTAYTATITTGTKDLAGNALAVSYVWSFTTGAPAGPAPVNLGTAGNFAILAKSAISTVPASAITGNVGVSPAATSFLTGFSLTLVGTTSATSTQVTGSLYGADMTAPTSSNLTTAVSNMEAAYTDAAGRPTPDFLNLGVGEIGGQTLVPGLYKWTTGVTISSNVTLSGGANDVWIFQIPGNLTLSNATNVALANGALAKNIFWQVAGTVEIGTGAHFEGIILSQTAIALRTGASMNGRALAQTAVDLETSTVTQPAP